MNSPITLASIIVDGTSPDIFKDHPVGASLWVNETAYHCTIKIHGNFTAGQAKKPYNIKLDTKAPLLGMASNKDWVLLANVTDRSFVNTALAMNLGQVYTEWAPRWRFIDLLLNGTYVGIYQVIEKVELASSRLDEPEVGTATTNPGLSGTYLMEINDQSNGQPKFTTTRNVSIEWNDPNMKNPGGKNTYVPLQQAFIKGWVQGFEDALFAPDAFTRVTNNYLDMIDPQSFASWYLIEELASNQDSNFSGSCKLHKMQDSANGAGVLRMGPIWDFDISFGNRVNYDHPPEGFYTLTANSVWLIQMFKDERFRTVVTAMWLKMKQTIGEDGSGLATMIDQITSLLGVSPGLDQVCWGYSYNANGNWSYAPVNYGLTQTKKSWISQRVQFLNSCYGTATS